MDSDYGFNVLRPEILRIGKRRYRKLPFILKGNFEERRTPSMSTRAYEDDDAPCDIHLIDVEKTSKGYTVRMSGIPSFYFKFICGKQNETKRRLEREMGCQIAIPRPGQGGDIVITCENRANVLSAKSRIELLVESARVRQPSTHFISMRLVTPEIIQNFEEFKQHVLDQCRGCRGIDSSIFQKPERLHLTIGLLVLVSKDEVERALSTLRSFKERLLRDFMTDKPIAINLKGIEYMNDDPAEVDVLYAKVNSVDERCHLQNIVDELVQHFYDDGLMKKEHDHVKLHVTVMNTIFRDSAEDHRNMNLGSGDKRHRGKKQRETFDARQILATFQNFYFGQVVVTSLDLSIRGEFDGQGYYVSAGSVALSDYSEAELEIR